MKAFVSLSLSVALTMTALAKPPPELKAALDDWIQGNPGGVALAWVDSDGVAFYCSGHLDGSQSQAVTPDTPFEIGSVTKVFTSILLAESELQGRVKRDDPAAKYLLPAGDPDQARLAGITLLALSTHTSGLPRLPSNLGLEPANVADPYAGYDRARLVQALRVDGTKAVHSATGSYSNFGAAVLGEALAAAWDTNYEQALREHVLDPLGLHATTLGISGHPEPQGMAPGHVGARRVPNWTFDAFAPAGALRSTARDMARFLQICLDEEPTKVGDALTATKVPQREVKVEGARIGLGWLISGDSNKPIYWHNGGTAGSRSYVAFSPSARRAVAILANQQKAPDDLGRALITTGELPPPLPKEVSLPDSVLKDYMGRYALSSAFAITVTEANGALFVQATGQTRFPAFASAKDEFFLKVVNAQISFERAADGKVSGLILHQNGIDQRAAWAPLPPPPVEITVSADVLKGYAGVYALSPAFQLTVTAEKDGLYVHATNQGKFPVFASAPDEFFSKIVDARITFNRGKTGAVESLVLHQGGLDVPGRRVEAAGVPESAESNSR